MRTQGTKIITCHLRNGASVCAVRDGQSIDTSMGFTPLEVLVIGTRSGDIDPGLVLYLIRTAGMTADEVEDAA
jgi:acetate kinase